MANARESLSACEVKCGTCGQQKEDNVVACDLYDMWHHYTCVSVSNAVEEKSWICRPCKERNGREEAGLPAASSPTSATPMAAVAGPSSTPQHPPVYPVAPSSRSGSRVNKTRLDLLLEQMAEEEEIERQEFESKRRFTRRRYEILLANTEDTASLLDEFAIDGDDRVAAWVSGDAAESMQCKTIEPSAHAMSKKPVASSQPAAPGECTIMEKPNHASTPTQGRESTQKENSGRHPKPLTGTQAGKPNVREQDEFLAKTQTLRDDKPARKVVDGRAESERVAYPRENETRKHHPSSVRFSNENSQQNTYNERTASLMRKYLPPSMRDASSSQRTLPTQQQILSRQIIPAALPMFDGSAEEWPDFLAAFEDSTEMCGLTNRENIQRLKASLKGPAYQAVYGLLLHPCNVDEVIETLRMRFGMPRRIINQCAQRIRDLTTPCLDRPSTVVDFGLAIKNILSTVQACGDRHGTFFYDSSLLDALVNKLPSTMKYDWGGYCENLPAITLYDFSSWIKGIVGKASMLMRDDDAVTSQKNVCNQTRANQPKVLPPKCVICYGTCLTIIRCERFLGFNSDARWDAARSTNVCFLCLKKHAGTCNYRRNCGVDGCNQRHHPLLHPAQRNEAAHTNATYQCNIHQLSTSTLLRVLPVILYGHAGSVQTYAMFDDGSELTLIEKSLADELELDGPTSPICLQWTAGISNREDDSKRVSFEASGPKQPNRFTISDAHTVSNLSIRSQTLNLIELGKRYPHLNGVDMESYAHAHPRLLIGLDNASLGFATKSLEGGYNEPVAVNTKLGWLIFGSCKESQRADIAADCYQVSRCKCEDTLQELHNAVKQYFSIDSLGIFRGSLIQPEEEQRAAAGLTSITRKDGGRYEAGLLWKYDGVTLPDSEGMARKRWNCLKLKLARDPELHNAVKKKLKEYTEKGYIRKLSKSELMSSYSRIWYLPVFPVLNQNKPGKLRLVWDAAAKTKGVSLNSMLLKGPDQITCLLSVLIRFREHKIAVCGDIREMFHQVLVKKDDQQCQRFFWQQGELEDEPEVYVMQVMTFGACCSPSIAQYVKNHNAEQYMSQQPEAVNAIIQQHFVDDMLLSAETEAAAINTATKVAEIHAAAGFEMRNWISNSATVSRSLLGSSAPEEKNLDIGETQTEKVLGMWWDLKNDCFTFRISDKLKELTMPQEKGPTKRPLLRVQMTIFDPLGFIAHFVMRLKVIIQELWRSSIGWDDSIPPQQEEKWLKWTQDLPEIAGLKIPRCFRNQTGTDAEIELHTFVDASEMGFAAVCYLRFEDKGIIECSIVSAKTKVAPISFLSIPKSELQAAVIGVRLAETVQRSVSFTIHRRMFWTDSEDVLNWLSSDHRKYHQFVAFRVSEILQSSDISEWRWVPSKDNVADDGTKWTKDALESSSRWVNGPPFLKKTKTDWPSTPPPTKTATELRAHFLLHSTDPGEVIDAKRFSKWSSLVRHVAFVCRFIRNLKRKIEKRPMQLDTLSGEELEKTERHCFRHAQQTEFQKELSLFKNQHAQGGKPTVELKESSISKMNPFMDEQGMLRSRSRIQTCEFTNYDAENPIILPKRSPITNLLLLHYHERYNHQCHETVLNEIRQRFRIICIALYRSARAQCQACKNQNAKPLEPMMASLPKARLAGYTCPFTHMGIDYFGPILVTVGRRVEKRWGVLATCLTTRAIHVELAASLSTDSCIVAIRNIWARRGTPAAIYSDRGTNFQGATKIVHEHKDKPDYAGIEQGLTTPGITWIFNTPSAPHMGGAWERLIQSVKKNLTVALKEKRPSHETLANALTEIENVVNSRPLTAVPLDDDESPVLTPNHFLVGSSNGIRSWIPLDATPGAVRRNWVASQQITDMFWKRWVHDYLPQITQRPKWNQPTKPLEMDDIVVIADEQLPRNSWPKGRIIGVRKATDGQVRSVTVQTMHGIFERPSVKKAVLDVRKPKGTSDSG